MRIRYLRLESDKFFEIFDQKYLERENLKTDDIFKWVESLPNENYFNQITKVFLEIKEDMICGMYLLLMLFLAGYDEEDFKMLESFGPMRGFANAARKITKKSPFYRDADEIKKTSTSEGK